MPSGIGTSFEEEQQPTMDTVLPEPADPSITEPANTRDATNSSTEKADDDVSAPSAEAEEPATHENGMPPLPLPELLPLQVNIPTVSEALSINMSNNTKDGSMPTNIDGTYQSEDEDGVLKKAPTKKQAKSSKPSGTKCRVKGCPIFPTEQQPVTCSLKDCDKTVHEACYDRIIQSSKKAQRVPGKLFCTLNHQKIYLKNESTDTLAWTNDGKDGRDDPKTSQFYLLQWLNTGNNLAVWRDPPGSATKIQIAAQIGKWIFSQGVRKSRNQDQVRAKIEWVEASMREAYDWTKSKTGEGLKETDDVATFREKVMKICPFYYELEDIFVSRAGVKPKSTNIELFGSRMGNVEDSSDDDDDSMDEDASFVQGGNDDDEDGDQGEESDEELSDSGKRLFGSDDEDENGMDMLQTMGVPSAEEMLGIEDIDAKTPSGKGKTPSNKGKGKSTSKGKSDKKVSKSGKKGSRTSANGNSKKKKKPKRTDEVENGSVDYWMSKLIKQKLRNAENPKEDEVSKTLRLAQQFQAMADALGSKIKAANAHKELVQFLDAAELEQLRQYQSDLEAAKVSGC